jgi:hypothetical protein
VRNKLHILDSFVSLSGIALTTCVSQIYMRVKMVKITALNVHLPIYSFALSETHSHRLLRITLTDMECYEYKSWFPVVMSLNIQADSCILITSLQLPTLRILWLCTVCQY